MICFRSAPTVLGTPVAGIFDSVRHGAADRPISGSVDSSVDSYVVSGG